MAFNYKTIGNTAAAVVSLLAVGTLCWWQRTPGPLNAPRPQDEAEIMTACLERHYAMGRTGTQFTIVRTAYVSQVPDTNAVGGVRYVTNSTAHTLTNTIGFFPNATFNYPQSTRDALDGVYGFGPPGRFFDYTAWLLPSNTYFSTGNWNCEDIAGWRDLPTNVLSVPFGANVILVEDQNWWTNWVTLSVQTSLASSNVITQGTNILSVTTQALISATSTRTSGGSYIAGPTSLECYWTIGAVFAENQDGTLTIIDESLNGHDISVTTYSVFVDASNDQDTWIGIGSLPIRTPTTLYGNYDDITLDFYGYLTTTNYSQTVQQVIVTNTSAYNAWTAGKKFAFERDSKPYWWSTNSYNDMARALSTMQWQINPKMYYTNAFAVTMIYTTSKGEGIDGVTNTETITYSTATHEHNSSDWTIHEWESVNQGVRTNVQIEFYLSSQDLFITNNTPFTWTNGVSFIGLEGADGRDMTNQYCAVEANVLAFFSTTNRYRPLLGIPIGLLESGWCLAPGQSKIWSFGYKSNYFESTIAPDVRTLASNRLAAWDGVDRYIHPGETNAISLMAWDSWVVDWRRPISYYRVQFSALTNYLNHAPAR